MSCCTVPLNIWYMVLFCSAIDYVVAIMVVIAVISIIIVKVVKRVQLLHIPIHHLVHGSVLFSKR